MTYRRVIGSCSPTELTTGTASLSSWPTNHHTHTANNLPSVPSSLTRLPTTMSKDSTSSTYAPHASSPGLSAFAHLNVSASPVSDVPPPLPLSASPQHIQSSTVLPDTPPTDQGQPPAFPPGSISGERPASPTGESLRPSHVTNPIRSRARSNHRTARLIAVISVLCVEHLCIEFVCIEPICSDGPGSVASSLLARPRRLSPVAPPRRAPQVARQVGPQEGLSMRTLTSILVCPPYVLHPLSSCKFHSSQVTRRD